jgi:uncharacterized 2Fe-2S/4Fe-4S cluster protein (DUF4445 family)
MIDFKQAMASSSVGSCVHVNGELGTLTVSQRTRTRRVLDRWRELVAIFSRLGKEYAFIPCESVVLFKRKALGRCPQGSWSCDQRYLNPVTGIKDHRSSESRVQTKRITCRATLNGSLECFVRPQTGLQRAISRGKAYLSPCCKFE